MGILSLTLVSMNKNLSHFTSRRLFGVATLLALTVLEYSGFAGYPVLSATAPRGAQRGSEVKIKVTGDKLADFQTLMFLSPGFTVKSVDKVEEKAVECTVVVAPEARTGNHLVRVVTKSGISHGRQFFVGNYPNRDEVEPNNDLSLAQPITINQTIEGVVQSEDVDYFKVTAKKGQRLTLEAEGLRLGYGTFDPYIAILDKDRFEKVSSDDTILHRQDGYCSWTVDEDGEYFIMMRDSSYRGSGTAFYRLHVGGYRRPEVVYPAGGRPGQKTKVRFIEKDGSSFEEESMIPADAPEFHMLFATSQEAAVSGNLFRVVDVENTLETEPNDALAQASAVSPGDRAALNGIIEKAGDVDFFKLTLKKGQKLLVQGFGQALGSPLDMVVNVQNAKGGNITGNDDGGGTRRLDSRFSVDIPADGDYYVRVADHLERGGANFVYRVELGTAPKELYVSSPQFTINDTHYRQFIAVPKGGRYATLVNVTRAGVSGDFTFEAPGLPAGMKLLTDNLPKDYTSIPLLFECTADAAIGSATVPLTLKSVDPAQNVVGRLRQPFDVVREGNVIYLTETHDKLPVAVVEEVPFSLEIQTPPVPLVAGGVMNLKVVAKRKEGFNAAIRLFMIWKPSGVSSLGEVTIPADANEAVFVLDAKKDVPAGKWKFTVMGEADTGKGRVYNASPFHEVETAPAYVTAPAMSLAVVEQGKETTMVAKLETLKPFEGEAVAQVVGVPDTIVIEANKITKDSKEVTFQVKTTAKSPVGKQANLFVSVEIPVNGSTTTTHRIAVGSILRIDAVRKAAPAAPEKIAAAKPKEAAPAAPKVLSRLEQLRQEAAAAK
jgi:hypothetical protein